MSSISNIPPSSAVQYSDTPPTSGLESLSNGPLALVRNLPTFFNTLWKPDENNPGNNPIIQICQTLFSLFNSIYLPTTNNDPNSPPTFFATALDINLMDPALPAAFMKCFNPNFFSPESSKLSADLENIKLNQNAPNPMNYIQQFMTDATDAFTNAFALGGGFSGSPLQTFNLNTYCVIDDPKQFPDQTYQFYAGILLMGALNSSSSDENLVVSFFENSSFPLSSTDIQNFIGSISWNS